jgi:hypothetical protein
MLCHLRVAVAEPLEIKVRTLVATRTGTCETRCSCSLGRLALSSRAVQTGRFPSRVQAAAGRGGWSPAVESRIQPWVRPPARDASLARRRCAADALVETRFRSRRGDRGHDVVAACVRKGSRPAAASASRWSPLRSCTVMDGRGLVRRRSSATGRPCWRIGTPGCSRRTCCGQTRPDCSGPGSSGARGSACSEPT